MASVEKLKPLQSGRRSTYDTKVSGLVIITTENGAKSWYLYKKLNGRPERHHLGKFPEVTVDSARDAANKLLARIASGDNPAEAKRKERGELTLGKLWDLYLEFHADTQKKSRSVIEDKGLWKRYLESWKSRKLSSITNKDVQVLHATVGRKNGKYAANRMLSLLSKCYSVAKDHGEWTKLNPAEGVKRFAEKSRDRFLQPDELPRFLKALDESENKLLADAFRLMLWTGARKMNVLAMTWDEVDIPSAVWRISDTKSNEPLRVPLTDEAIVVLKRLKAGSKKGQSYVFPARVAGSATGHIVDVTKAWRAVIAAAGLPELRIHDLRRTMGSWQALGGSSLQTIGKSLGHKNVATTEIYARLMMDQVRTSMASATAAMMAAGKTADGTDGGK